MVEKQGKKIKSEMEVAKSFRSGKIFISKTVKKQRNKKTPLKITKTPLTNKKKRKIIPASPSIEMLNAAVNQKRTAEKQKRRFSKLFLNLAYKNIAKKEKNSNALKRLHDIRRQYEVKHQLQIANNIKAKTPEFTIKAKVADFMRKAKSNSSGAKSFGGHDIVNENSLLQSKNRHSEEYHSQLSNETLEKLKIKNRFHSGIANQKSVVEKTLDAGKSLSNSLTPVPARTKNTVVKKSPLKIKVMAPQHSR